MNSQLKKGIIELVILNLLNNKELYGSEIVKLLEVKMKVKESSIYIILTRLNQANYISFEEQKVDNRKVKVYSLTATGKVYRDDMEKMFQEMNELVEYSLNV